MSDVWRAVAVLALVLGNAIFVAAEYALVTARRNRLEDRAEDGNRRARTALRLMDEPVRFISTVQVGITVLSIALGVVGEPLVSQYFEFLPRGVAFVVSFSVLTYLSVVLGELVPKAVALQKAELLALALAVPIDLLSRAFAPVVWVLQHSSNAVLRVLRVKPAPAASPERRPRRASLTRQLLLWSLGALAVVWAVSSSWATRRACTRPMS